jgi:hypothetical protein
MEVTMSTYLPMIVWLVSVVVCINIARKRHLKRSFLRNLLVVLLGPFAIPLIFLFKPDREIETTN